MRATCRRSELSPIAVRLWYNKPMLLTFVQLHILLAAAPAFANWVLLCPSTLGNVPAAPAQVVSLACQNVLEGVAPTVVEQYTVSGRQAHSRPAVCQRFADTNPSAVTTGVTFSAAPDAAPLGSFAPFPHPTRAP